MEIDLEVIGKHPMLFDDDAQLQFVNSKEALIEWNSLFIDRFDVRNLITSPPTTFRNLPTSFYHGELPDDDSHLYPLLDVDRFADLNHVNDNQLAEVEPMDNGGYNCVPFSYGNSAESTDPKDSDMSLNESSFHPPFPLPDNLLQSLPSTEKVHQIIARTAMFVGEHGGQSEIVLRVKQGDNPTFGFLMPHHHLHPYFRYLVDHPDVLRTNSESRSEKEKTNEIQGSGALSLLGSVYGSGDDDEVAAEANKVSEQTLSGGASITDIQSEQTLSTRDSPHKDETVSIPQLSKVKASAVSIYGIKSIKPGRASSIKSDGKIKSLIGSSMEKPKASSLFPVANVENSLVDPPCEMKRLVDRIIEVILKNGRDFEKVLIEQDKNHGKFPFLLPSNQYNPYYLRVLKKAQESRISGKTFRPAKDGSSWQEIDKNDTQQMKDSGLVSLDGSDDLDLDLDKKEKFKMVISKPKKDSQDQQSKGSREQCGYTVDTEAAAAILQAATRGIRKPNLNVFSKPSHGTNIEVGPSSGCQRLHSSQPKRLVSNENGKSKGKTEIPDIDIEAHSSESGLMRQQKLKAERLRRAKMFAAMIKSGVPPLGTETVRASSVEQSGPENIGPVVGIVTEEVKGREGSFTPMEALPNLSNNENEHKLSKRRHYRSRKHDDEQGEEGSDGNEEESENDDDDQRRSRKRHKSLHSTRQHRYRSKDHKHRRKYSSSKSKESRHQHKHESSSSLEDDDDRRHQEKLDDSSEEECKHSTRRSLKSKESRRWVKHGSLSSLEDDDNARRWEKPDDTSEEERKHRRKRSSKSKGSRYRHNYESSSSLDDDDDCLQKATADCSSEKEQRPHKRLHRNDNLSENQNKDYKRRHKRSHRKDRNRERSVKNNRSENEEVELEEGEIRTRSSEQSLSVVDDNVSREASVGVSKSPGQEKGPSLPPPRTTEVPDELRAKIRAMLLATM